MIEEMKKEFELYLLSDDCGWCDGKEWQMGTREINNLWNWFESKLKSEIAEACKKQRLICSRAYLDEKGYEATNSIMATVILNAPSPEGKL